MTDNIIARPVPFEDMMDAARKIGDLTDARSQENILLLAQEMLATDPEKMVAVMVRLKALIRLMEHPRMHGWAREFSNDMGIAHLSEPLIRAAADQPLIGPDNDLAFDPDAFFDHVLELSGTAGRG